MLVMMLVAVLDIQDPHPGRPWVLEGGDDRRPLAVVVSGDIELSRAEAIASARRMAVQELTIRWTREAQATAEGRAPLWMPEFVRDRVVREFIQRRHKEIESSLRIHEQDMKVRDHGFGPSYQSHLLLDAHPAGFERARPELESRVDRRARRLVAQSGGLIGLFAVLAFLTAWLDRLSRGYMTWRLRLLACGVGAFALALVLVV